MKKTGRFRKVMSLLLTITMMCSLMPSMAFGADPTQITKQGQPVIWEAKDPCEKKGALEIEKTIQPVADGNRFAENKFEITLKVSTSQLIGEIVENEDAAVVILLDSSHRTNKNGQIAAMKSALTGQGGLLDMLVTNNDENTKRMVAVAKFTTDANTVLNWTDVTDTDELQKAKNAVNDVQPNDFIVPGLSNVESSLKLASNLLKVQTGIEKKYVLILSDAATVGGIDSGDKNSDSITKIEGVSIPDVWPWWNKADRIDDVATYTGEIEAMGGTIFSAGFKSEFSEDQDLMRQMATDSTNGVLIVGKNSGDKLSEIKNFFGTIGQEITTPTPAWTVTDPMGKDIMFDQDALGNKAYAINTTGAGLKNYNPDTETLTWKIDSSDSWGNPINGKNVYATTYQVVLDNTAAEFDFANLLHETNGTTTVQYYLSEGNRVIEDGELDFIVPAVQGFAGNLSFKKVAAHGNKEGLQGAEFTLTSNESRPGTTEKILLKETSVAGGLVEFKNIPSGYTYILEETKAPQGYEKSTAKLPVSVSYGQVKIDGNEPNNYLFENKLEQKREDIPVLKEWVQNGQTVAPAEVKVTLVAYDEGTKAELETQTITLKTTGTNKESEVGYFKNVPANKNAETGNDIGYTVTEEDVEGYTLAEGFPVRIPINVQGKDVLGFLVKNIQNNPKDVTLPVEKMWISDASDAKPESVTVVLVKDGIKTNEELVLTEKNGWKDEFTGLDLYAGDDMHIAQYSIYEKVTSTDSAFSSYKTEVEEGTAKITNIINQEDITINGTKTWKDDNNAQNTRPASIKVQLMKNGLEEGQPKDVSAADDWKFTFEKLPKYTFTTDESGKVTNVTVNIYTVEEQFVTGYAGNIGTAGNSYALINTATATTDVSVKKIWVDVAGTSHGSVTMDLLANGRKVDDATFTDTHIFENVAKYDADGKVIKYTVQEIVPEGYAVGYDVVTGNDGTAITVTNTLQNSNDVIITINKLWKAPADAQKPTVTMQLQSSIDCGATWTDVVGETLDLDGSTTSGAFTELPKYAYVETPAPAPVPAPVPDADVDVVEPDVDANTDANTDTNTDMGTGADAPVVTAASEAIEIMYKVVETTDPTGYIKGEPVSEDGKNWTITNTIFEKVTIDVTKNWITPAGEVVPDVVINLLRNDPSNPDEEPAIFLTRTIASGDSGTTFADVSRYTEEGLEYTYSVAEKTVTGYSPSGTGTVTFVNGTADVTIVNTKNMSYVRITGNKHWIDPADRVHRAVEITLLQDGKEVETVSVEPQVGDYNTKDVLPYEVFNPSNAKGWPEYHDVNGVLVPYEYSVVEKNVPEGYEASYSEDGFEVYNILKQNDKFEVSGQKFWNAPVGMLRPDITVQLQVKVKGTTTEPQDVVDKSITLTNGETDFTFEGLKQYDDTTREELEYSVKEVPVVGYTSSVDGFSITNTIVQDHFNLDINKQWMNVADGVALPESVTFKLVEKGMVDGKEVEKIIKEAIELTALNGWKATIAELPMYTKQGQFIIYELTETTDVPNCEEAAPMTITGKDVVETELNGKVVTVAPENTMLDFQYRVYTHYTTVTNGLTGGSIAVDRGIVRGTEGQIVTITDMSPWTAQGGFTYTFEAGNPNNVVEVTLAEQGVIYDIHLYYTRNVTTTPDTPSIPSVPGGGGGGGTIITGPDVPLTQAPVEAPVEVPVEEAITIAEPEVPLAEAPAEVPVVEIPEEPVPLSDVPPTGDNNKVGVYGAFLVAAAGAMLFLLKKKETEK